MARRPGTVGEASDREYREPAFDAGDPFGQALVFWHFGSVIRHSVRYLRHAGAGAMAAAPIVGIWQERRSPCVGRGLAMGVGPISVAAASSIRSAFSDGVCHNAHCVNYTIRL
jgi:hypothetical protein